MFDWLRRLFAPSHPQAQIAPVHRAPSRPAAELAQGTPELIAVLLEGRDEALRVKAANALSERLPLERNLIVPALVKATQESSAAVRRAARAPMSHGRVGAAMPGVIDALREGLDEPESADRHAVIAALGSQTGYSDQFFADMCRCLRDADAGVRSSAAYYVADFLRRGRAATEELWAGLADPSAQVRRYLVRGLGRSSPGDQRVNAVVLEILRDAEAPPYQLDDAVELIGLLAEPAAAALLDATALAAEHPGRARVAAARTRFPGLAEQGARELEALLDGTERQRVEALRAAPKVHPRLNEAALRAAAPGQPGAVRAAALTAARELHLTADQRLALVREAIDAPDRDVRWATHQLMSTLTQERPADVVELCTARLGGADRDELARVLGWLGGHAAAAVPRLVECLEREASSTVVYSLGSIGAAAREALPALARLASESGDAYLRSTALEAMQRIGLGGADDALLERVLGLAAAGDLKLRDSALSALETAEPPVPARVRDVLMESVVREEGLPDARRRRVTRLAQLGAEVTPALLRALEDRDEQVAAEALGAFERLGAAAVPHLERMRDDPACGDAARARFVLEHLGGRG